MSFLIQNQITFVATIFMVMFLGCKAHSNSAKAPQNQNQKELSLTKSNPEQKPQVIERKKIESLVSFENQEEKKVWLELLKELLSPCGEPVSIAQCIEEGLKCSSCVPSAKYLARLINEAYEKEEAKAFFELRYSKETFQELDLSKAPIRGSTLAPVTITVFSDFQCPFCAATHPKLERVLKSHKGKVRLAFKHYPLSAHSRALPAAKAAIAAEKQGKFWQMHDLLFKNNLNLEDADLLSYAKTLKLDIAQFKQDMESTDAQKLIDANKKEGEKIGVEGTPTILINGRHYAEPIEALAAYIDEELLLN